LCHTPVIHSALVKLGKSPPALKLDRHVHLVGNGRRGSGCWIKMAGWHRMRGHLMCRTIGMPVGFEHDDFDAIYPKRLCVFVAESSLDHVLLYHIAKLM